MSKLHIHRKAGLGIGDLEATSLLLHSRNGQSDAAPILKDAAIEIELWAMPEEQFGSFLKLVATLLRIGTLRMDDGSDVKGFMCKPHALETAEDISHYGGWRLIFKEGKSISRLAVLSVLMRNVDPGILYA